MPINRLQAYNKLMEDGVEVKKASDTEKSIDNKELEVIKQQIKNLEKRNEHVELNKARETSTFRTVIITVVTYVVLALFFYVAELPNPFIGAVVPTIGFVLTTLSFPFFKDYRIKHKADRHYKHKKTSK